MSLRALRTKSQDVINFFNSFNAANEPSMLFTGAVQENKDKLH